MSTPAIPWRVAGKPRVVGLTAPNPGSRTLSGTHTYIVGRRDVYIIDPGPESDVHTSAIAGWLAGESLQAAGILLTHGHPDHAPGARTLSQLLGAPVWAAPTMPEEEAAAAGVTDRYSREQRFDVDGHELAVFDTPGHKQDHVAFWLPANGVLFVGDSILGSGSTLVAPPDGDMAAYMRTLSLLRDLSPRIIAPGHGPIIRDPSAKIDEYVRHRQEREQQIVAALEQKPGDVDDIVKRVYVDVDPALHGLARGSVEAQLKKLEGEGRVRAAAGVYTLM